MCWQFLQTRSSVRWQLHSRDFRLASEPSEKAICTCLKLKKSFVLELTWTDSDRGMWMVSESQPLSCLDQEILGSSSVTLRLWFWICYFHLESGKSFGRDMFSRARIIFSVVTLPLLSCGICFLQRLVWLLHCCSLFLLVAFSFAVYPLFLQNLA